MEPEKPQTSGPANSYTFDLPYDNDLDQEELNRRLRKPGEPPYRPPARTEEPADRSGPGRGATQAATPPE